MRTIRNTTVCVVGGAGFLGSHLVDHLINDRDCQVVVIDNLCAGRREFVHRDATFIHHDITGSEEFLRGVFRSRSVRFVFNLAAWPYIPDSFDRPLQVFSVNATGAIKVINAAHEAGCEAILQYSSAELYGDAMSGQLISESHPAYGKSTYGAAKLAADAYCRCRWKERGTPVISLRQFNCVGERETHPYVIPEIISQLSRKPDALRLGNNSERDFLYAGDAVRMAAELLENGQFGEVYNSGSQESIHIYRLAMMIGNIMEQPLVKIVEDPSRRRPDEIWSLRSDNSKIYSVINYRPEVGLQRSLELTVSDFQKNGWCWE